MTGPVTGGKYSVYGRAPMGASYKQHKQKHREKTFRSLLSSTKKKRKKKSKDHPPPSPPKFDMDNSPQKKKKKKKKKSKGRSPKSKKFFMKRPRAPRNFAAHPQTAGYTRGTFARVVETTENFLDGVFEGKEFFDAMIEIEIKRRMKAGNYDYVEKKVGKKKMKEIRIDTINAQKERRNDNDKDQAARSIFNTRKQETKTTLLKGSEWEIYKDESGKRQPT